MIHYFIGYLGHFLVILSLVTAIIAAISFYKASVGDGSSWLNFSKYSFYLHAIGVLGVLITLFIIINRHYFEYHYAWNYSSKYLPIYYQISSFWNGQEGSFLLWMFWNVVLGLILLHTNKFWRAPVMTIMSVNQIFLSSMVLGVVMFDLKIGSSPFMLLREVIQDNIFKINPEFIPPDGNGLNPLLQNYWMVIHPPTLFLGFASTVVPFAFALAGVWRGKYKDWIRPALPWAQFSVLILGIGILMGAYWAYETLNFGGYWNWDPVENAIYVPWLTLAAGMHTMIAYKKNPTALKASLLLVASTYILILYSTFLTRSGVLGETSVHSFTDLGLSGQLLIFLIVFIVLTSWLFIRHWKNFSGLSGEVSAYSREFWIFMGATVLCLMAFQVIIPTSIPVWNELMSLFGIDSNLAPPAEPVEFYSKFQLWFAIALAILSGTGQFFWWKKMDRGKVKKDLRGPVIITLLISSVIFLLARIQDFGYILLLTASIYSVIANGKILLRLIQSNIKLSGGSIAHMGVAMMLIGILFSSGYSKIISRNNTGLLWSKEFPEEMNRDNLLLFLNEPRQMGEFTLLYKGVRKKVKGLGFIDPRDLRETSDPLTLVLNNQIIQKGEVIAELGDTVKISNPENSFYEVVCTNNRGENFTLYPRIQINKMMGTLSSPDIKRTLSADLYTHISNLPDPEQEPEWSETVEEKVRIGDQFFINDFVARFASMERLEQLPEIDLGTEDVAVKAIIEIDGEYETYLAEPIYVIKDRMAGRIPQTVNEVAAKITILDIHPEEDSFTLGINTTQKDWIIIEAVEKPWINILWIGTLLIAIGFSIAIWRRYDEFVKMKLKNME